MLLIRVYLRGKTTPNDIPKMIWLFRVFNSAPYFRDAITAWQNTDQWIIKLGDTIDKLILAPKSQVQSLTKLHFELDDITRNIAQPQADFQEKMSLANRVLANILSVVTVVLFIILGCIATILLAKLTTIIRRSEYKFRSTFENAAVGIAQLDQEGRIVDANKALSEILGYSNSQLLNMHFEQLTPPEDNNTFNAKRLDLDQGGQESVVFKQRLQHNDQRLVWVQTTMSCFKWGTPNTMRYICILEDISEQQRLSSELSYQARHDNLTGLLNRRAFDRLLTSALTEARNDNLVHCLCFIDLDQFKVINDTLGHFAGDQLLLQVTQLFSRHLRKSDVLARLGGDEFGLILNGCQPQQATTIVEGLRKNLSELPFTWEGRSFNIGCSIGIIPITADSSDEATLLQAADSSCHMAKEQGRNRIVLTYQGDEELAARRVQMEWIERIRTAIECNRLYLDAQKIVAISPVHHDRIEVLVRMLDENENVIPPSAFLPAAERFGLAHLIDRWVLKSVCAHLQAHPLALNNIDACHINISGKSFDQNDFVEFTLQTIADHNIPANKLCIEITETAAVSNLALVQQYIEKLSAIGCTFALDDFGAGLSSFAYLKQFPVHYLKIDGTFVRNMPSDSTDKAIVTAISDIGKTLDKIIVAEFVEDQETLSCLQDMGVEFAQGFYLHKPEKLTEVVNLTK